MGDVADGVQALVNQMAAEGGVLRVLEAGCGSRSYIQLPPDTYVVGIDVSQEQLDRTTVGLSQKILGDIQTFPLEPASFDIIFCWDVLEHLPHPELALANFSRALAEGGIVVLGAPIVSSLKGMITKYTPHTFHVLVYRHLLGSKNAGRKGYGPFPTFLKYSMSPRAIQRFAHEQHLSVVESVVYVERIQTVLRERYWPIDLAYRVLEPLIRTVTLGRVNPHFTDFIIVLKKLQGPAEDVAQPASEATFTLTPAREYVG
jgi:SAM-dependent methyltransferase